MGLPAEKITEIINKFSQTKGDTASPQVQIALLTERLRMLNDHFKDNAKDHHSRRGLLKLVGQRRKLLRYLHKKNPSNYQALITELGIRR